MTANHAGQLRIGVDTGGTFTDLVAVDADQRLLGTYKLLSTPGDPAQAVLAGIDALLAALQLGPRRKSTPNVVHGSTMATNALLEHASAPAALVTTAGFEDVLAIARQDRPELYARVPRREPALIGADARLGVRERVTHDGQVLVKPSVRQIDEIAGRLRAMKVEAVAVCLLHSYANSAHERLVAERLRGKLGADVHLTVSHELLPEYREYERTATCVVNAVVAPRMVRYLDRLTRELGESRLRVMASHGGTLPPRAIRHAPVRTVLSGPAGGVLGAAQAAQMADAASAGAVAGAEVASAGVITFDMGGTSTDVALCRGDPLLTSEGEAGGVPVRLPMIDMHTVGAGGGSIAWIDEGGALRVGPRSAGAEPGPACYGRQRGELLATVTDAHVVLGHIPADQRLGESLRVNRGAAVKAVHRVAQQAGLNIERTAAGILRVAEATMARAIGRISLQRGRDPRDYALVPFGGAGGLHACRLAEAIGMRRVLVPNHPGLLSAVGMLGAGPRYTFSHALMLTIEPTDAQAEPISQRGDVARALAALEAQADEAMAAETAATHDRHDARAVDLRYAGQSYELTVPLDDGDVLDAFRREHQRLYGYAPTDRAIEVVTVRLTSEVRGQPVRMPRLPGREDTTARCAGRKVAVHDGEHTLTYRRLTRDDLYAGDRFDEPMIVAEYSATTVVPPGWSLAVNAIGQLILEHLGAGDDGDG
ncbi:MAG: hydantoinase/oxoprolinase family protein [Phycisphaeraceae bacterium]